MIIEKLQHGLFLCKKNFGRFVECWNDIVDRVSNLRGDGDLDDDGCITVDYTDDTHPVIRFNQKKKPNEGSIITDSEHSRADCEESNQYSIDIDSDLSGHKYIDIYKFGDDERCDLSSALDMQSDIILRTKTLSGDTAVDYLSLSDLNTLSGDADIDGQTSSIISYDRDMGKAVRLFNFEKTTADGTIALAENKRLTDTTDYQILIRDNEDKKLKYYNLSVYQPNLSGDSQYLDDYKSVLVTIHNDGNDDPRTRRLQLYNFDNPDSGYIQNFSKSNPVNDSSKKFLVRDNDDGTLRYSDLSIDFNWISGDSEDINCNDYKSIQTYVNGHPTTIAQLYKFTEDEGHTLGLEVPSWYDYYYAGKEDFEPTGNDKNNMDLVVRNRNGGQNSIDYRIISCEIPPFVHGDADAWIGGNLKSIDSMPNIGTPNMTYYQLHNWNYPAATTIENNLISSYINLANGIKKGDDGDNEDYFLIRNSQGELVYKKIYAKAENGSWDEQRITNIENDITNINGDVDDIRKDISDIIDDITDMRGDINDLSNTISGLSGNYWEQGGNSNTNYGSSIGNSSKTKVIDLDSRTLVGGDWTINEDLKVNGDITCDNDIFGFNVNGTNGNFNTIKSKDGADITVDNNIDMSNHEIKNASKIGDINLTTKQLVGDWKTTGEHTVDGCINCDWVFKNDGSHGDGVNVGGLQLYGKWSTNDNFAVNGTLTIGSTTITESQLQQLLALLNSSNNILNQSF